MSCLLNALTKKSNLTSKEKRENPDKNGGFEMGTWTFPKFLHYFENIAGKDCIKKENYDGLTNKIEIYNLEACKKIAE